MKTGGWDVHTHLIPGAVLAEAKNGRFGLELGNGKLRTPKVQVPLGRIDSTEALAQWVRDHQLTGALVSPPPPLFLTDLDSSERSRWVSVLNESMQEACSESLAALPLAYLPLEDPLLAMRTLDRLEDGWAGVAIGTDATISDDALEPLWRRLAERRLTIWLHPSLSSDPRLRSFYMDNLMGNPTETAIAIAHFIFGGVLTRNPELIVVAAHGGGVVSVVASRWQRGWSTKRPDTDHLKESPLELLSRIYVDTVVHDPYTLHRAIDTFGVDRMVLGTDWPFPMGLDSPNDPFPYIPEESHREIRTVNASTAFRLPDRTGI